MPPRKKPVSEVVEEEPKYRCPLCDGLTSEPGHLVENERVRSCPRIEFVMTPPQAIRVS